ncbi:hypothetical protein JCM5353_005477 [Sporobolomyces roseus]
MYEALIDASLFISWLIWDWCVKNFGNVAHLHVAPWSYGVNQLLLGLIAFLCRGFYAYRIWIVGKRKIVIPIITLILSFAGLGFALACAINILKVKYIELLVEFTWGVSAWLAIACISDALITISLVYYLKKSQTGLLHTNSILNRLIEMIVSTNGLTAACTIVSGILFWALSGSWHVIPNLINSKLYLSALLVSLNARIDLKRKIGQSSGQHSESHGLTDLGGARKGLPQHRSNAGDGGDVRTALGFGIEDIRNPDSAYVGRGRFGTASIGDGIKVTTHQTVATDGGVQSLTYIPSEKESSYYSNEKDEEASNESPVRSLHFAPELDRSNV